MAEKYGRRPSEFIGFANGWLRWQFDRAVLLYGRKVDSLLSERRKNGKPRWTLQDVLNGVADGRKGGLTELMLASGAKTLDV
jgi:hypothetical protein